MRHPVLLLPRPAESFIVGEHAADFAARGNGSIVLPGRVPFGALTRAPAPLRGTAARQIARVLMAQVPASVPASERVVVAYHAIQWPVVRDLLRRGAAAEAWYCRWDRYEAALDAGPRASLLAAWHDGLASASALTFCVSERLSELEREAGREAITLPLSADAFPEGLRTAGGRGAELVATARAAAGQPMVRGGGPVGVSLGHLGRRTDWRWLRAACERLADLELLLIGSWHEDEVGNDPDFRWLRAAEQVTWLGRLSDEDAADVIAQADVGLVPFLQDAFNDCGLPNRILKYARLGRHSIAPPLAGCRTWETAMQFVGNDTALTRALADSEGRRDAPDADLHAWALTQTVERMNDPLLERLG